MNRPFVPFYPNSESITEDMKFYIHTEDPPFTMVVKWNDGDDRCLQNLIDIFLSNFKRKYPEEEGRVEKSTLEMWKGRKSINLSGTVLQTIKNMDDIYVKWKTQSHGNTEQKTSLEILQPPCVEKSTNTVDSSEKNHLSESKDSSYSVRDFLELAASLSSKCQLQHAIVLYKDILHKEPKNQMALVGIADCYLLAGRPTDALKYLKPAQNVNDTAFKLGQCYVKMGEHDKAVETLIGYSKELRNKGGTTASHKQDVQVLLAKAYIGKKQTDMALVLLQGVLRENKEHVDALAEYAPLIYPLGSKYREEAMTIMLTVLINKGDDNDVKEKFAYLCQQEHGMEVLKSMAGAAWKDVPAVVFLATSLRDVGAIEQAEALLKHAYMLQPENPHTLLTYIHTLELVEKHTDAVQEVVTYIKRWPEKEIGMFKIGTLLPIMTHFHGEVHLNVPDVDLPSTVNPVSMGTTSKPYSEDMNYLLAILFTLVKILYIKGALAFIRPITNCLDSLTKGHELHKTNVRNEAAYFSCINQLQTVRGEVNHVVPCEQYVYFIGDSHCVPPAWQCIQIKGEDKIIHPILSTGTKIWHLRDESTFYPKYNFNSAISKIPDGATTVFCFGEIDCREALLLCVEKGKYDSLEEGMDRVIEIYISLLARLQNLHGWDVYVHPVLPLLDLTRSVVMQFNQRLIGRLLSQTSLKWLDFVDNLLTKESGELKLKKQYEFDGTHAHPRYLKHLQQSLQNLA
ncbi:uncharacterized protein LOC125680539 isoform X2 [Ostrea edulis]|uniref:uncharacterized protein LOC125680539 isoform X2 n=1 Tax=Ostrea edulis TaxID=37623 RepID=UPI0024AF8E5C|nr:uncharacterized protein LOC125680539 isoform X2 [Ostrea edulis]